MRLEHLVRTTEQVGAVSSRTRKIGLLAELLSGLDGDEVAIAVAFLSGGPRQGRIGIGGAALRSAATARATSEPSLTLADVDRALGAIATISGAGANAARVQALRALLERATAAEHAFLLRLLYGELRVGALEGILLDAVAKAADIPSASLRRAAAVSGDLGKVTLAALTEGVAGLARFEIVLFRPLQPMLAQTAESVDEAMDRLGEAAVELKIDGARIQVHKADDEVRVYTRNLREVTPAVPEVVEIVRAFHARSLVLDGEVIALRADQTPHPFQMTMRRFGRRLDVDRLRAELPLTPLFFDCLYADDRPLVDQPQSLRFDALREWAGAAAIVTAIRTSDRGQAGAMLRSALERGHEGVMMKAPAAPYTAGSRGQAWLKVKATRSLDLVVLAAEWGSGRRRGWLSNLHLGARDTERGGLVMLGKTFKGLTDELLTWQTREFLARETGRDAYTVFVKPELVVEIVFNDLQVSPVYPGGLALRFARVKGYRPDKSPADADTFSTVQDIYRRLTGLEPPARR